MTSRLGRFGVSALIIFAACTAQQQEPTEIHSAALGVVPATEIATWTRVGKSDLPDERYGQATTFDETRGVVVMFGGLATLALQPQQDTWEWNPSLGGWKDRTITSSKPAVRSGAAMAYDSTRKKFILFGGRAGSGYNLQDTWEWDPDTGIWADKTTSGAKPEARCLHGMVFDRKNGKVLLFGGGRTQTGGEAMSLVSAFDDTWEYDGATATWAKRTTAAAPSARGDFGFAYSSETGKAYLFGGYEVLSSMGTPKQDTWEWDGQTGIWTERTLSGSKPSSRFGHSMAIDSVKGLAVVLGGYDINTGGFMNDLWYLNLTTGVWEGHDQPAGTVAWPQLRQWSSMVANPSTGRIYVIAGQVYDISGSMFGSLFPNREIWELNPTTTTWVDRSAPSNTPGPRFVHAMAADPVTGKVYVFSGGDAAGATFPDMWEWNGTKWTECPVDLIPPPRTSAAMAYDPTRKSFILFGGNGAPDYSIGNSEMLSDTWEWNIATRKWSQLTPAQSPGARYLHGMVTDTARNKILLYSGINPFYKPYPYPFPADAGAANGGSSVPTENQIWEWDGTTWTDRSPPTNLVQPGARFPPSVVFDDARNKMVVSGPEYYASADYWEWDPTSGGWSQLKVADSVDVFDNVLAGYDSIRRRVVKFGQSSGPSSSGLPTTATYELDTSNSTWYLRKAAGPDGRGGATMAFDNRRGVMVLFGGSLTNTGFATDETWEYKVTGWGNGAGCTTEFAAQCASGNCVDGVCCESASCSGACKSCNVPGKAGTCVLASPGTQIAGSCSGDQACDSTGACKTSNGKPCTGAATCASGFCTDGVCCDGACTGLCQSCSLAGKVGTCSPFALGTDPEKECGEGTPPCHASCSGSGSCAFPAGNPCLTCGTCNGYGTCNEMICPITSVRTSRTTGSLTSLITAINTGTITGMQTAPYTGLSTGLNTGAGTGTGTGTYSSGVSTGTLSLTGRSTGTGTGSGTLPTGTGTGTRTGTSATATGTGTATRATTTATGTATGRTSTVVTTGSATSTGTAPLQTGSATATFTATPSATNTATSIQTKADAGSPLTPRDGSARDGSPSVAGKLGQGGCSCDLGSSPGQGGGMGSLLGILGALLIWRRKRR